MRAVLLGVPMMAMLTGAMAAPAPVKRADVEQRAVRQFDEADTDHDGYLSHAEYVRVITLAARRADAVTTPEGWARAEAQWKAADPTGTGRISRAAFVAAALAHFDGADLNRDGTVTPEEARKAAKIKQKALDAAAPK